MQQHSSPIYGLLGAIIFSSGLASPIALADEEQAKKSEPVEQAEQLVDEDVDLNADKDEAEESRTDGMVEVRISLPDGRTIIRLEPARKFSAKRSFSTVGGHSRILADGSRISYGRSGVSGGSNGASAGSSSGGGGGSSGGGGGGSAGSGGGGGSSSSSLSSLSDISSSSLIVGDSGTEAAESSGQSSTEANYSSSLPSSFSSSSTSDSTSDSDSSNDSETQASSETTPASSSSSSSGSSTGAAFRPIHTIGDAQHDDEDSATGGQSVEFHDAGMSAVVVGNSIYFSGVELVQMDQAFEVLVGTRIGADSVIMQPGRPLSGSDPLSEANNGHGSPIKLDFESDTIVELAMLSQPENPNNPQRELRTWTVRIR